MLNKVYMILYIGQCFLKFTCVSIARYIFKKIILLNFHIISIELITLDRVRLKYVPFIFIM